MKSNSQRVWAPNIGGSQRRTHWFYERVSGEYLIEQAYLTKTEKLNFSSKIRKLNSLKKPLYLRVKILGLKSQMLYPRWRSIALLLSQITSQSGTISLFLAQHADQVYGVEIVPEAIEDARSNAFLNEMRNVKFEVGASEEGIPC